MKTYLSKVYYLFHNIFLDSHLFAFDAPKLSFCKRVFLSWDYRLSSWFNVCLSENSKKLYKYKNKHKNKRCFIIGNGPTLNSINLKLLKNEITFGVNAIYTNYDNMEFFPTYYVVEDKFVAEDRKDEINNLNESVKFFGNCLHYCLEGTRSVVWINTRMRYDKYKNFPNFSKNALRQVWVGGTVSFICMQLAYYMGFNEVYLVGFDHNYVIPKEAQVQGNDILSKSDDPNHFNKEYFGKGKRWHDPMLDRMELAYKKAKTYFEDDGRKIINATVGGNLAIFDRIKYESLFDK